MDSIAGQLGDNSHGAVIGKENQQRISENQTHVNLALNRIADADESTNSKLTALVDAVAGMKKALVGEEEYGRPGIIEQIREMRASDARSERWHAMNSIILVVMAVGQVAHTAALIYLFRWIWGI
mgnify:CR=1 FL=1